MYGDDPSIIDKDGTLVCYLTDNFEAHAAIKACGWVNIKPGRVGGITNAVAIHNHCLEKGIPCWIGGMLESAVGAA